MRIEGGDAVIPFAPHAGNFPAQAGGYRQPRRGLPRVLDVVSLVVQRLPWTRESRFLAAVAEAQQHRSQSVAAGPWAEPVLGRDVIRKRERAAIESLVVPVLHEAPIRAKFDGVGALHPT